MLPPPAVEANPLPPWNRKLMTLPTINHESEGRPQGQVAGHGRSAKKLVSLIALVALPVLALSSCSTTQAYRKADGTLLVTESGNGLKSFGIDTSIGGALPGQVTPASQLSMKRRAHVKPKRGKIEFEGFVDWRDPQRVEIRMVTLKQGKAYPLSINGRHRVHARAE